MNLLLCLVGGDKERAIFISSVCARERERERCMEIESSAFWDSIICPYNQGSGGPFLSCVGSICYYYS